MSWATEDNKRVVYASMRSEAHKAGFLTEAEMGDKTIRHGIMTDLIRAFEEKHQKMERYPSGALALKAFMDYLAWRKSNPIKSDFLEKLSLNVTLHYGTVSISIGIEDEFYVPDQTARQTLLKSLRETIDDLHREQARDLHTATPRQSEPPADQQTEEIEVTSLQKDVINGKTRVRVIGGRFAKFGAPLYIEAAAAAGIDLETLPPGTTSFTGKAVVALRPNGNALKVLEITL